MRTHNQIAIIIWDSFIMCPHSFWLTQSSYLYRWLFDVYLDKHRRAIFTKVPIVYGYFINYYFSWESNRVSLGRLMSCEVINLCLFPFSFNIFFILFPNIPVSFPWLCMISLYQSLIMIIKTHRMSWGLRSLSLNHHRKPLHNH